MLVRLRYKRLSIYDDIGEIDIAGNVQYRARNELITAGPTTNSINPRGEKASSIKLRARIVMCGSSSDLLATTAGSNVEPDGTGPLSRSNKEPTGMARSQDIKNSHRLD